MCRLFLLAGPGLYHPRWSPNFICNLPRNKPISLGWNGDTLASILVSGVGFLPLAKFTLSVSTPNASKFNQGQKLISLKATALHPPPSSTLKSLYTSFPQEQFEEYDQDNYICTMAWYDQPTDRIGLLQIPVYTGKALSGVVQVM